MTLSVAAVFPWGALARLRGQGVNIPQAVVFATDCRWTFENSTRPALDTGRKLFQVAKEVAAVYAGDVKCGEECIGQLSYELMRASEKDSPRFLTVAERTFKRTYAQVRFTTRRSVYPLHILMGACSPHGAAGLWYFSSEKKFVPVAVTGVCAIGAPQARQVFAEALNQEAQRNKGMFDMSTVVDGWALKLASLMFNTVITSAADPTVGGKVQLGVIDQKGFRSLHVARTPVPFPSHARPKWQWVTSGENELVAYDQYIGRGSLSTADLQLHQIAE